MSKGVLIIIDPQNDFTNRKGYYAQHHSILQIEKAKHQISHAGGVRARVVEAPVAPGLESTHVVLVDKR